MKLLEGKDFSFVQELKDRNRGMILLLIERIRLTGNARFIPLLKAWEDIEYKKVQAAKHWLPKYEGKSIVR